MWAAAASGMPGPLSPISTKANDQYWAARAFHAA